MEMEVVKNLDMDRYMGRWYEIACFPSRFQPKDGVDTRATYTMASDGDGTSGGTVKVLNETWSGGNGKRGFIEGTAYKADPNSDEAKLKVKFYVPPFLPIIPIVGDYWVLYVDLEYSCALVGQPSRSYLWVLCRENHMEEEVFSKLVQKAVDQGYDVSKLQRTSHSETPPPVSSNAGVGGDDTKGVWWIKSLFGR